MSLQPTQSDPDRSPPRRHVPSSRPAPNTGSPPPVPRVSSHSQRSSAHSELQAIRADYYDITDAGGAPVAGLVVLLDRKQRPVRAELHLNRTTSGARLELAQRQARLLITNRYHGLEPLPLTILRASVEQEPAAIKLEPPPPASRIPDWARPAALALAALLVFGALGWYLNDALTGAADPTSVAAESTEDADEVENGNDALSPAGAPDTAPDTNVSNMQPAADTGEEQRIFETNDLPASRNALPLDVGQRIRVRDTYNVALRTEPGPDAGQVIGTLGGGDQATIINGPVWLQGTSDTIVWWRVRLDSGLEAWLAANTSELTLVEPVP